MTSIVDDAADPEAAIGIERSATRLETESVKTVITTTDDVPDHNHGRRRRIAGEVPARNITNVRDGSEADHLEDAIAIGAIHKDVETCLQTSCGMMCQALTEQWTFELKSSRIKDSA